MWEHRLCCHWPSLVILARAIARAHPKKICTCDFIYSINVWDTRANVRCIARPVISSLTRLLTITNFFRFETLFTRLDMVHFSSMIDFLLCLFIFYFSINNVKLVVKHQQQQKQQILTFSQSLHFSFSFVSGSTLLACPNPKEYIKREMFKKKSKKNSTNQQNILRE